MRMRLELSVIFLVVTALAVVSFSAVWTQWCIKTTGGTVRRMSIPVPVQVQNSSNHKVTGGRTGTSFVPLSQSDIDGVERFVLFMGHSRSGHSIISAMMDAHPNIVIANEYQVLHQCVMESKLQSKAVLFNGLFEDSYRSSKGARNEGNERINPRGYNLHVNTPWQGTFSQLRVIGDKDGGGLSGLFARHPVKATKCFNLLRDTINIPIVMLHVIRNPFDMIATVLALKHGVPNTRQKVIEGEKLRLMSEDIMRGAEAVFNKAKAFMEAINSDAMKDLVVVEIHSENFIKHPREHINKICQALSVPCPVEYVEACYEKVYKNISKSREIIEWDDNVVKSILRKMKQFPFFSAYTLDSEGI